MENIVFNYSEKTIKERKKILFLMGIMIPVTMLLTIVFMSIGKDSVDVIELAIIFVVVSVFVSLELMLVSYIMFKKLRSTKLVVCEEGIERIGGKSKEFIKYSDIKKLQVKNDKYGKLLFIKVNAKKRILTIYGFDNMENILNILKENVCEDINISEKQHKVDWNSPFTLVIVMLLTCGILIGMMKFNLSIYRIFNILFPLVLGGYFLFFKPISKASGARFRIFEIIIACVMIIATILSLF